MDNIIEGETYLVESMSKLLNRTLVEYLSRPKEKKCKHCDVYENKRIFNLIFNKITDKNLVEKLQKITVEEFYTKVFINEENILGEGYENIMTEVLTLNKQVETKVRKRDPAFQDTDYVNRFIKIAQERFIARFKKEDKEEDKEEEGLLDFE